MKIVFLLFALVLVAYAQQDFMQTQFDAFKLKFSKSYKSVDEESMRFRIFKSNIKRIARMNMNSLGQNNYGVTQFTDLTPSEFSHMYLMPKRPAPIVRDDQVLVRNYTNVQIPAAWDWRKDGLVNGVSAITPVYNQGQCGSCWAFSATEQTESMDFLQKNASPQPLKLSMQQVVDCDTSAYGCNGGWTYVAYEYIEKAGGYEPGADYPYTARDGKCAFDKQKVVAGISKWSYVTNSKDEATMKNYVATTGPLSICVDAASWQFYHSGVIRSCGKEIDHCVQIVGYGTFDGVDAWTVRNSWGTAWGYSGFLYVEYGKDMCAIAQVVTTVETKKP